MAETAILDVDDYLEAPEANSLASLRPNRKHGRILVPRIEDYS